MHLLEVGDEDGLRKRGSEGALTDVGLLVGRHGRIQHVLRVLHSGDDSKGQALAIECLAKSGIEVDDAVGEGRHGGVASEEIQVFNGAPRGRGGFRKNLNCLVCFVALCVAHYAGTEQERNGEYFRDCSVVRVLHFSCTFSPAGSNGLSVQQAISQQGLCIEHTTRGISLRWALGDTGADARQIPTEAFPVTNLDKTIQRSVPALDERIALLATVDSSRCGKSQNTSRLKASNLAFPPVSY